MAALQTMLAEDRRRADWSVGQAARRLGVSIREYREIEAGERWSTGRRSTGICLLNSRPQTFVTLL